MHDSLPNRLAEELKRADLNALVTATCKSFGSAVYVFEDCDPEFPDDRFIVLAVDTTLSPKGVVKAEQEWVRSLRRFAPSSRESVRLLIRAK